MEVPLFFTVSQVAQMLGGLSEKFLAGELRRGRFFPIEGEAIDASTVRTIAGKVMVSLRGVHWYLGQFCSWPQASQAQAFLVREVFRVPALPSVPAGIPARSEGELLRKVSNG